jgi:hypothetical protein
MIPFPVGFLFFFVVTLVLSEFVADFADDDLVKR